MKKKWNNHKEKARLLIKITLIFLIFSLHLVYSSANTYSETDLQWTDVQSNRLEWGQSFTVNHDGSNYKIGAVDFVTSEQLNAGENPFVFINLYKNNVLANTMVLTIGNPVVYNDEVKLTAIDIIRTGKKWSTDVYNPWAVVEISFRGVPDFAIYISSDKSEYDSPTSRSYITTYIEIKVSLKNIGSADAKNVKLNIDTGGLNVIEGQRQILIGGLKKGESKDYTLKLEIPKSLTDSQELHSYKISVNAQGEDIIGTNIIKTAEYVVNIKPKFSDNDIIISKYVSPSKISIQEKTVVELIVRNAGLYNINNIAVSDEIPNTIELVNNDRLYWIIPTLKSGEEKKLSYTIKIKDNIVAQKEYMLPPAKASFTFGGKSYYKSSNAPKISVELPPVTLTKTLNSYRVTPGSTIGVTVTAKNVGDRRVKVSIQDDLPTNAVLVSGNNSGETFLDSGETYSINYAIKTSNIGTVNFPSAVGKIRDIEGKQWDALSDIPSSAVVAYSAPTPSPRLPTTTIRATPRYTPVITPRYSQPNIAKQESTKWGSIFIVFAIIAIGSFVTSTYFRMREIRRKIKQHESEGYDVSEYKDKWGF